MPALKRSWQPGKATLRSGARLGSQHFPQGLEGDRPGDTGSLVSLEFHFPPDEAGALPGSQFTIGAFSQRYAESDPLGCRFQAESRIDGVAERGVIPTAENCRTGIHSGADT